MNKINLFIEGAKALAKKAGLAIANTSRKCAKVIVANKVKSIVIGSAAAVAVGGTATTVAIVNNNKHEHEPLTAITENYVAPTCESSGSYDEVVYCDCKEELDRKTITVNATGHTEVKDDAVPPTCTEIGLTEGKHCSVCNEVLVAQTVINALNHDIVNHDAKAPTCTEIGWDAYKSCSRCDYTTYVEKLALGHTYTVVVTNPTCTNKGYTTHTCHCGDSYVDTYVDELGHDEIDHNAQDPTCTEIGWDAYKTCSRCDYTTYVEKLALGHTYTEVVTDPACTDKGFTTHTCHCGDSYVDSYVDALGHTDTAPKDYVCDICSTNLCTDHVEETLNAKAPTCTATGLTEGKKCSVCGQILVAQTTVDMLAHTEVIDGAVAPTCTKTGLTEGKHCSVCNTTTVTQTVVDALNHDIKNNNAQAPTCTAIGWDAYETCSRCDYTTYVEKPATGHSYTQTVTKPTSTAQGYTTHTCHCGDTYKDSYTDPIIDVTSITLNKTEVTINIGDSFQLIATILPENATDKTVTWHSSDETIAKVVNGAVSALNMGTVTITATTANGLTAQCIITVIGNAVIKFELSENHSFYIVSGIEGRTDKLEIPFLHDGLRVKAIKAGAFYGNTDLKEVILPNSIEHINAKAFMNCSNLETINFPESLISIEQSAFENCKSIKSIVIPSLTETVSAKAFYNCTALKAVTLSEGVKHIGVSAFAYCSALETVIMQEGLETIDTMAFDHCISIESFDMPNTVTSLGNMAFRHAESLKSITFSTGLTTIGNACFQSCVSLDNVELHAGIVSLGESCFSWCSGMKTLRILGDITFFGNSSFYECTSLENVYFASSNAGDLGVNNYIFYNAGINGNGIVFTLSNDGCIPDRLFEPQGDLNRPKLVKLIIEDGTTRVDYFNTYNSLPYLEEIELPDSITYIENGCFNNTAWWHNQPDGAVYIGNVFYGYKGILTDALEIPNSTVCIAMGALEGQKPTSLTIPFIGASANDNENTHFGYIFGAKTAEEQKDYIPTELEIMTITNSATSIGDNAFYNYSGLTSVTIPDSVTCIGDSAFYNCSGLTSVTIPDSVTCIGDSAFYNCSGLTSVTIPDSVTCIGDSAFYNCSGLASVTVPDSVTCIGDSSFSGCNKLISITLPFVGGSKTATSASSSTLFGYIFGTSNYTDSIRVEQYYDSSYYSYQTYHIPSSLKSVTITGGNILYGAFYNCSELTSVTIGNSVTSICNSAFYECSGLTSITIPDSVTSIGGSAFKGCSSLERITLPFVGETRDGTSNTHFGYIFGASSYSGNDYYVPIRTVVITGGIIGDYAFYKCSSLTSVTIGNSVTNIGECAFSACSSLESITLPFVGATKDGTANTHFGYIFGARSYSYNYDYVPTSLKTVVITGGSIGDYAFYNCSSLTSVTIGNSVTSIDDAFGDCSSLARISVDENNENYKSIDGNLYTKDGKTLIKYAKGKTDASFTIPDSVTSIGHGAFRSCKGLTSITIPDSVTSIGGGSFYGCSSLESITLPFVGETKDGTSNTHFGYIFGASSYSGNDDYVPTSLKTVVITGGTSIGDYTFYNCRSLTSVALPDSVTSIADSAFYYCSSLTSISVDENNANYTSIDGNLYTKDGKTLLQYAIGKTDTSFTIPDSVTNIGDGAFGGCKGLTSITIPDSVTSIGEHSFYKCSKLESITLPFVGATKDGTSNTHFGYIFGASSDSYNYDYVPTSLKTVIITGGTSISNYAFRGCSSLTSITIPDNVTSIGEYAFYYCTRLTSIAIPDNVTSIGEYAFYYCTRLTSIAIPDSVTSIGNGAFKDCSRLTSITIPDSVTSIGGYAFCRCSSLKSVTIGNSVTSIGDDAFYNCSSLRSITIPDSVTSIGDLAFSGCQSLTSVTIGNSVTSIGVHAFAGCWGLTSVTIGNSVTSIGDRAFFNCEKLRSIKYRGTWSQWYDIKKGSYWLSYISDGSYDRIYCVITYDYTGE